MITKSSNVETTAQIRGTWTISTADTVIFEDISLDGSLTYTSDASTGVLLVSNCIIGGTLTTVGTLAAGSKVRIIASNITGTVNIGSSYKAEILSSKLSSTTTITTGEVIGSYLYTELYIKTAATTNDTVQIIGNYIRNYISWSNANSSAIIANNNLTYGYYSASGKIRINTTGAGKSIKVSHNNISIGNSSSYDDGHIGLKISNSSAASIVIDHNYFIGYSTSSLYGTALSNSSIGYSTVLYNAFYKCAYTTSGADDVLGNISITLTSSIIDAGSEASIYNDVDATRADIGYNGGAYPYLQYSRDGWVTKNSRVPRVYSISAPKTVLNGQSFSIEAKAFDH